MSIRTYGRRLGDASDNISTAIWGNTQYGIQTGQEGLIASTAAQLQAQGIDPATATRAQILSVYFTGQAQQVQALGLSEIAAADRQQAAAWAGQPPAPVPVPPIAAPAPAPLPLPAPGSGPTAAPAPAARQLSNVPTWAWVAGGVAALFFFSK